MKVWDLPTRLYHWLQAALCFVLLSSGFTGNGPHELLGSGLMILIIWRIGWGFIGSETSRFSQFVKSPKTVWRYFRAGHSHQVGHNPAGGWMVLALLTLLSLQCLSGMVLAGTFDDIISSNSVFADTQTIGIFHAVSARLLVLLIGVHLIAIVGYKIARKPLVKAMLTGYQEQLTHNHGIQFAPGYLAIVVLAFSFGIMFMLIPM